MSDLEKLNALAAEAAERGATIKNAEFGQSDSGDVILQASAESADIEVSIPGPMQIAVSDIDFNTAQLSEGAAIDQGLREWTNAYLAALVDDADRQALVQVRKAIDAENLTARSEFRGLGAANFLTINTKTDGINRALLAPSIVATQRGPVLLPILGAARQGNMGIVMSISAGGSFRATGKGVTGEIQVTAGRFDSLHALNAHGRAQTFASAFSLPLALSLPNGRHFSVGRNFTETQTVGQAQVPKAWMEGDAIKMSYCPVALGANPNAARMTFRTALKHIDMPGQEMAWASLRNYNLARLFEAYVAAGDIKDAALKEIFAQALACQIETMLKSI